MQTIENSSLSLSLKKQKLNSKNSNIFFYYNNIFNLYSKLYTIQVNILIKFKLMTRFGYTQNQKKLLEIWDVLRIIITYIYKIRF